MSNLPKLQVKVQNEDLSELKIDYMSLTVGVLIPRLLHIVLS